MERRITIQTKHYKAIDTIAFEDTDRDSIMEANNQLRKYNAFVTNNGFTYNNTRLCDLNTGLKYPMRERRDHTIIREEV